MKSEATKYTRLVTRSVQGFPRRSSSRLLAVTRPVQNFSRRAQSWPRFVASSGTSLSSASASFSQIISRQTPSFMKAGHFLSRSTHDRWNLLWSMSSSVPSSSLSPSTSQSQVGGSVRMRMSGPKTTPGSFLWPPTPCGHVKQTDRSQNDTIGCWRHWYEYYFFVKLLTVAATSLGDSGGCMNFSLYARARSPQSSGKAFFRYTNILNIPLFLVPS